jgi:hypothetical protein
MSKATRIDKRIAVSLCGRTLPTRNSSDSVAIVAMLSAVANARNAQAVALVDWNDCVSDSCGTSQRHDPHIGEIRQSAISRHDDHWTSTRSRADVGNPDVTLPNRLHHAPLRHVAR